MMEKICTLQKNCPNGSAGSFFKKSLTIIIFTICQELKIKFHFSVFGKQSRSFFSEITFPFNGILGLLVDI